MRRHDRLRATKDAQVAVRTMQWLRDGSCDGTSASNGPGGGTEAVNLEVYSPDWGALGFWGVENLRLPAWIVPVLATVNLGLKSTDKRNGPGERRTGALGPPIWSEKA